MPTNLEKKGCFYSLEFAELRIRGGFLNKEKLSCEKSVISEKRGAFWNPKNQRFHRHRGSFTVKVSNLFNMENTDGLHKFPVSGGTGRLSL